MSENRQAQDEQARIRSLVASTDDRPDHVGPVRIVAVVSTQRSGSTLFCDMLSSSGLCPPFEEWFNRSFLRAFAEVRGIRQVKLDSYAQWVNGRAADPQGRLALKLHVNHIMEMEAAGYNLFDLNVETIIGITRRDKLAQALSLAKARLTGKWRHDNATSRPQLTLSDISNEWIFACLAEIGRWDAYFQSRLAPRMDATLCYEDFVADPAQIVRMLKQIGWEPPAELLLSSRLMRQSDERDSARLRAIRDYLGWPST